MDRPKKIIQYAVTLCAALAALIGGMDTGAVAATVDRARPGDPRTWGAQVYRGWGFDTCLTPPLGTMRAWRASRYRAIGVYFGGRGRACKHQPYLSHGWLHTVDRMGWKVLPIYVGSQSPCVWNPHKRVVAIGRHPWHEGRVQGRNAVRRAHRLGIRKHSPLYLDMEAYDARRARCARTTLAFIRAWSRAVRRRGYFAGFYSSAESGVQQVERARRRGARNLPQLMWFARWRVRPSLYSEPVLQRSAWRPHRRIHQYLGNVTERHGGRRLKIDANRLDAPIAIIR